MKRQKERPANKRVEPPVLPVANPEVNHGPETQDGRGFAKFLPAPSRYHWLFALLLVAATFIAYQPVWQAGFIWDDDAFLTDNPVLKRADGLYRLWFTASTPDYFPMTSSMLWLEWRFWGYHAAGYHLVNILLHAFSAVSLWRVLLRLKIPGAMLAAAIFALHPVNVESVAWITERKNTLAMFFYVSTVLCWLKFEDGGGRRWYGLALAGFALALLSKTAVAPLPVVLLGLAWWRRGRVTWEDVRRTVPFFLVAAVLALVTVWFQYHRSIGHEVVRTDNFWSRLAGGGMAVWFYLYKVALPLKLAFVYPRWQIDPRNLFSYLPLALLVAGLFFCWRTGRRWGKPLFFGLGYFVVMLLPVLGFLNIYFMEYSLVSDHWQYFAMIGPVALAAAGFEALLAETGTRNKWLTTLCCVTLLGGLGALTWKQCGMYTSSETLWETTLRLNPNAWIAFNDLGFDLLKKGQVDAAMLLFNKALQLHPGDAQAHNNLGICLGRKSRTDEAISQFKKALELKPDYPQARNDLGLSFFVLGRLDEAVAQYQKALELQPDYADAHFNLGNVYDKQRRSDDAVAQYQKALEIQPDFTAARMNLGNCLTQLGRVGEAAAQFQKAVQLAPDDAGARYNLGNSLAQAGRTDEAITQFQKAVELKPDDADAQYNLGGCFIRLGRMTEAIAHFQKASELAGGRNPDFLHTLATAFAAARRFDDAAKSVGKAIQAAQAAGRQDLTGPLNEELKRYKSALPSHQ